MQERTASLVELMQGHTFQDLSKVLEQWAYHVRLNGAKSRIERGEWTFEDLRAVAIKNGQKHDV